MTPRQVHDSSTPSRTGSTAGVLEWLITGASAPVGFCRGLSALVGIIALLPFGKGRVAVTALPQPDQPAVVEAAGDVDAASAPMWRRSSPEGGVTVARWSGPGGVDRLEQLRRLHDRGAA